jgi:RND family efflux transporter MFP subunit
MAGQRGAVIGWLASLSIAGCGTGLAESSSVEERPIVPVVTATRGDLSDEITLTGEFTPYQEIDVMAKVAGYVKEIRVDIGDRVQAGDLLATLEIPEMEDDLAKADAARQAAADSVEAAQFDLQRAEAAHQIAHLSFHRTEDVAKHDPGVVPQQEVDAVRSRDLEAEAQIASAKANLAAARQRGRMAEADETRLRTLYRYTRITAPFNGVITKRYANVGSMIQAGTASQSQAMPIVRLAEDDLLRLSIPVPEENVPAVRVGTPVEVDVRALRRTFAGKVTRFSNEVQKATRTMTTEIDVPNPAFDLVPGLYADVRLKTARRSGVLSVPLEALAGLGSAPHVFRVDAAGLVHLVPVTTGLQTAQQAEIQSGLAEGDLLVAGRLAGLRDGQRVTPKPAAISTGEAPPPAVAVGRSAAR